MLRSTWFLGDNETIYFQSEATGYSHLYTYSLKLKLKNKSQKETGKFVKLVCQNKKHFYLTTNTTHPGNRDFYKMNISDGLYSPF
jgi:hypothetical protein